MSTTTWRSPDACPPPKSKALRPDSWPLTDPPLPRSYPPLISVRQLYMLGLTISPETRVWVVTPSTPHPLRPTNTRNLRLILKFISHAMIGKGGWVLNKSKPGNYHFLLELIAVCANATKPESQIALSVCSPPKDASSLMSGSVTLQEPANISLLVLIKII